MAFRRRFARRQVRETWAGDNVWRRMPNPDYERVVQISKLSERQSLLSNNVFGLKSRNGRLKIIATWRHEAYREPDKWKIAFARRMIAWGRRKSGEKKGGEKRVFVFLWAALATPDSPSPSTLLAKVIV